MQAPSDFQPQLVHPQNIPVTEPPSWVRSERFAQEEIFAEADQHAIEVSQLQHESFKDLLFHLVYSREWSEIEAARVIFRWMTSKDMLDIEFGGTPPGSPEELLAGFRDGKSTFCRIFEVLCLYSGIPCLTVVGYAKGIEFRPGMQFQGQHFNHSWNVIFVEGAWQLVDSHWATRYLQSSDTNVPENMVYEYDDFYFCPDPENLIYSHFPHDPKWQLLRAPLSMYDFEDLPIAKSAFFKNQLKFLSHHQGVVPTLQGALNLSLGNFSPLSFTFKLLYGDQCSDEVNGVKLNRYGIQETRDGQVNFTIKSPAPGFFYLTVYSAQLVEKSGEMLFSAVCEYKIICDQPYPNCEPYPFVSDTNWGPGANVYKAGLIPSCRDAVIIAHDGHVELDFDKIRPMRVLPKLHSLNATDLQCEGAIKQDDTDFQTRMDIDLPTAGEYALEIYANDPEREGNTYTHVCQYLIVQPKKGDNSASTLHQAPTYGDCYRYDGMKEPLPAPTMSLEQLATGLSQGERRDPMTSSSEMRPGAKAAAMRGVKVEQITVPKPKERPSSTGSQRGDKPAPPIATKPKPKTKPKPSHSSSDYGNLPYHSGQDSYQSGQDPSHPYGGEDYLGDGSTRPISGDRYGDQYGVGNEPPYGNVDPSLVGVHGRDPAYAYGSDPRNPEYANQAANDPNYASRAPGYGQPGYAHPHDGSQHDPAFAQGVDPAFVAQPGYGTGAPGYSSGAGGRDPGYGTGAEGREPGYGSGVGGRDPAYGSGAGGRDPGYGTGAEGREPGYGSDVGGRDPAYGSGAGGRDPGYGTGAEGRKPGYGSGVGGRDPGYSEYLAGQADPEAAVTQERERFTELGYAPQPYKSRDVGEDYEGGIDAERDVELNAARNAARDAAHEGDPNWTQEDWRNQQEQEGTPGQILDEDFPAPPPASDMLNMQYAPERQKSEIPKAPQNFEPTHIAELEVNLSNLPKPAPPEQDTKLVFRAERALQFKGIDTHAVQVAKTEHNSFRDLIWDLVYSKNIEDDLEKARVIFLWLCTKDLNKMKFRNVTPGTPEEILLNVKQGKATYAQIYETLCSYAGLHCRVIRGYAKGAEYRPGMRFLGSQAFHAWNSVLIYGHWRLIDCHWASRRMFGSKGTESIRYELDDYYFCVDPRQLAYTHFPEDPQWQLLEQTYQIEEFEDLPLVKSLFFRYGLQLESHLHAVIQADDQFALTVNHQYYRGPGLEFTFSIQTNEGEEKLHDTKLSRFGVQDSTADDKINFWVRPPAVGLFKLAIYAREVQQDEANRMYCAVIEYLLDVSNVPEHIVPFPECSGNTWGISQATAKKNGVSTKFTSGVLYTQNGHAEIRFKLSRQLLFSGKLKSTQYKEVDLQSCILYRTVGETAVFSVSVPAPGEYGLEVFVNDPTRDGKMLRHMCQYLLVCEEEQVSGIRFPQLPAAYLGPQQAYARLGMKTISHKDPLIHCQDGTLEVSFETSSPVRATSNLILTPGNQDYTEYILQQFSENQLSFMIRLPAPGIYKFQIFAQPIDDASDSLPGVYNYLINCGSVSRTPLPFPKQFSQWKEGCTLITPVDGDLAACQSPQDPTPDYIYFQVIVPSASKVAVVVGSDWTHLDLNHNGVWEGAATFQMGWGNVGTAALTANFGADSNNYNTLLEFRM